jgi:hypothetical protein
VVAHLLVAPDTATTRRRVADHAETFARAYPLRGRAVTRWLAAPVGPLAGVLLLPPGTKRTRKRIRVAGAPAVPAPSTSVPAPSAPRPRSAPARRWSSWVGSGRGTAPPGGGAVCRAGPSRATARRARAPGPGRGAGRSP